jgi:hypothetical protein
LGSVAQVVDGHWPGEEPLRVVVVARPGARTDELVAAVEALGAAERVDVVGAELGWAAGWRDVDLADLPVALEVPRGSDRSRALDDVAEAAHGGRRVVAKLRTGPTPTWPWPDERELAAFLVDTAERQVAFRLTGGLHHAVRGTYLPGTPPAATAGGTEGVTNLPSGSTGARGAAAEENHGVLNVLLATAAALDGAAIEAVADVLARRDAGALAAEARALDDGTAARVRRAFTAYGCCEVTDPVGELAALGLDVGS